MTAFYFIRHGQMDFSLENTKFFQGRGRHMIPLSDLGRQQIRHTAQDERLRDAQLIISSPYGRALHPAAILSKELGLELLVESDLHEWQANTVLEKYRDYRCVIVRCHGTLMQHVLDVPHPDNGQIIPLKY